LRRVVVSPSRSKSGTPRGWAPVFCVAHREDDMSRHGFTGIVYILIRSPFSVKNAERKALTEAAKEAIARAVNG